MGSIPPHMALVRGTLTVVVGLLLATSWVLLLILQLLFPLGILRWALTDQQKKYACGWIFRTVNYIFVILLNPMWRLTTLRQFPFDDVLKSKKGVLVMINHLSNADPWFAIRPMWPIDCKWICKGSLMKLPFAGPGLKNAGDLAIHFTSDKGGWGTEKGTVGHMMAQAVDYLEHDQSVAVFPEGVRSFTPEGPVGEFKDGFFTLAVENGIDIVPMALSGTDVAWSRKTWMFGFAHVYASCGDIISPEGHTVESLKKAVWTKINDMREAHPDRVKLRGKKQKS